MHDNRIIELFFARDEAAIAESERKYGSYCRAAAMRIVGNEPDAEEILNDTYLRAWNSIPPERPVHLRLFLAKIARNLAINRLKEQSRQKRGGGEAELCLHELAEFLPSPERIESEYEERELVKKINLCLRTLPERDAGIFINRYFHVEETAAIARKYGMTLAATQKILQRTKAKLKAFLISKGYEI